jgi:nicotinamidase-related amidase
MVEQVIDKPTFGSTELVAFIKENQIDTVELIGICTDICVVSNAL